MYKRQVSLGLLMMVVVAIVAAIIANIDPFHTNEVWTNWIALTTTCIVSVVVAIGLAIGTADGSDKDYFAAFGALLTLGLFFGAMFVGLTTSEVKKPFTSLVWGSFAAFFVVYVVTSALVYLAKEDTAAAARKGFRRVA